MIVHPAKTLKRKHTFVDSLGGEPFLADNQMEKPTCHKLVNGSTVNSYLKH